VLLWVDMEITNKDLAAQWMMAHVLCLEKALDSVRLDEAKWWYEWFFGKPQSGKLGIERLEEARKRIEELESR
jgi:hypothetical protein